MADTGRSYLVSVFYSGNATPVTNYVSATDDPNLAMPAFDSKNQDGRDSTDSGTSTGPTDYQAVHFTLSGLPSYKTIANVQILPLGAADNNQRTVAGTSPSLIRVAAATTADLYMVPLQAEVNHAFQLIVTFTDGTGGNNTAYSNFAASLVSADLNLAMPSGISLGQDEHDLTSNGSNWAGGGDGFQDIHLVLSGIPSSKIINTVDVVGITGGGGEWRCNIPGTDKAAVQRIAGATTADLYVSPFQDDVNRTFSVAITYTDGTTSGPGAFYVAGINSDNHLPMPPQLFNDGFSTTTIGSAWSVVSGTWNDDGSALHQTNSGNLSGKKLRITSPSAFPSSAQIVARVRVDAGFGADDGRVGVSLFTDGAGNGYNFVFHGNNTVTFLNDGVAWGSSTAFTWSQGTWYWFKFKVVKDPTNKTDSLYGKVWADLTSEPSSWTITQTGWTHPNGAPALEGGSGGAATASFDDVTVSTPLQFHDNFNAASINTAWSLTTSAWTQTGGVISQISTASDTTVNKKALDRSATALTSVDQEILAKVRVDSWTDGGDAARAGVYLHDDSSSGLGYGLLFHYTNGQRGIQLINDLVLWSPQVAYNFQVGT